MIKELSDFVFSKEERMVFLTSLVMLLFVFVGMGVATVCFSVLSYKTFGIFTGILFVCAICLLVEHIRNRDVRMTRFSLSTRSVSLQYGNTTIAIEAEDEYQISVLRLYQALGRGYTFKQYLVLWKGSAPEEGVHPFVNIKNGCVVLPLTESTLAEIKQFACCAEIPEYPMFIHHSGLGRINISTMLQR